MTTAQILKAQDFSEVAEVRPDQKKRVPLGKVKKTGDTYKVYVNSLGQIILDPQVSIPASEKWLWENKAALASVQKGLADAAAGRIRRGPSFAKHANDKLD